jgi:thiopurine S-methyltransferase
MEPTFWHQRWAEGSTGWHQAEVDRLLQKHWAGLALAPDTRVLVPLCGKSLDMRWLADRGHRVRGVELSPVACAEFVGERSDAATRRPHGAFESFQAGRIQLLCGDIFDLQAADLADVDAIYDRAALIALPAALRGRYAQSLYARLPAGCRGLLITLEFPAEQREGPPFTVSEDEIRRLLEPAWTVECLERRDILDAEPRFRAQGVTALSTAVYRLHRAAEAPPAEENAAREWSQP